MDEIEARYSDLVAMEFRGLKILAFKAEGRMKVYNKGQLLETYPFSSRSGGLGPKRQVGDGQISEGIYQVEGLSLNSSYHLSLRLDYPNAEDLARAATLSIADPGNNIYIHGKSVSSGCLAIGDAADEERKAHQAQATSMGEIQT